MNSLDANSKRIYHRVAAWGIMKVGLAITERPLMPAAKLHLESLKAFISLVESADIDTLCREILKCDDPLPEHWVTIKTLLKLNFEDGVGLKVIHALHLLFVF